MAVKAAKQLDIGTKILKPAASIRQTKLATAGIPYNHPNI